MDSRQGNGQETMAVTFPEYYTPSQAFHGDFIPLNLHRFYHHSHLTDGKTEVQGD